MDAGCLRGATYARRWIALALTAALAGCSLSGSNTVWREPYSPPPVRAAAGSLASAQANFERGQQAASDGDPVAVDYYYAAAVESWPLHAAASGATGDVGSELYRAAVRKLIVSAANYGRFDSRQGVTLADGLRIPVRYYGFLWQPEDFCCVLPVGTYAARQLPLRYASTGVGTEFIVLTSDRPRQPFIAPRQPFAATAVLKPVERLGMGGFALEFYDPLRTAMTSDGLPLARDLTAPIAYAATQEGDAWLEGFIRPSDTNAEASLSMNEPFQPGKIPLVLVHGLASSPVTWSHLENDLRAQPTIMCRYQIWVFRYDTGDPFLTSAAALRRQLAGLRQTYDPIRGDPNVSQMVLVGHSLGGLVSKLQVTNSGNELWSSAAKVPIDSIRTDADTRARLANSFFFAPSPDITRVIYIATPHRGSVYAQRCAGLIGSALVVESPDQTARHAQLVRDNPGAFHDELNRGIPTSIDLLEPTSCILQATGRLPYRPAVALHSIIGDDRWTLSEGRSDGVVAVSSARLVGVQSELSIGASHTEIQGRSETSHEVLRILVAHAAATPMCQ